jgi:uncharacterized membrane protein
VDRHGVRFGLLITLYALFRKERRNMRLDKRDEAIFQNLRVIMEHLGVGEQWNGPVKISRNEEVQSLKRLYLSLQMEIQQVYQVERVRKMNQVNWTTLIPGLISAAKLVLQSFGIDIPDEHINAIVNGAAAVGAIIAIFLSHKKGDKQNVSTQHTGDTGTAV